MSGGVEERTDAEQRYLDAVERRQALIDQWESEGKPFTTLGGATGRSEVEHPLVKMIERADALCDRLAKALPIKHRGPKPVAVVKPSPAQKLRAVK